MENRTRKKQDKGRVTLIEINGADNILCRFMVRGGYKCGAR